MYIYDAYIYMYMYMKPYICVYIHSCDIYDLFICIYMGIWGGDWGNWLSESWKAQRNIPAHLSRKARGRRSLHIHVCISIYIYTSMYISLYAYFYICTYLQ